MSEVKEVFFNQGIELSESEIDDLVSVLTPRCSHKTKTRIRSLVTYDLNTMIKNVSWFNRFYVREGEVHYCAGQSYPCEIRAIRSEMLKKYP